MRLNGVEPSRPVRDTRPSTLRVYQFRHSRLRGATILDVWGFAGRFWLRAVRAMRGTLANKCSNDFDTRQSPGRGVSVELDLTKRQKEIFDFIGKYAAKTGYPADGAGDRQSGRPALVLDRARAPRQPGEDRLAPTRPVEAAGDRAALRQGEADDPARQRAAAGRPGRRRRADPRRRERRGVHRSPRHHRWRGRRLHPQRARRER